jgi:ATP-binding cassette subfamily B protein
VAAAPDEPTGLRRFLGVFRYSRRAIDLVWSTSRTLTVLLATLTLVAGLLPAGVAYLGQLIVDAVVAAGRDPARDAGPVLRLVAAEALLVVLLVGAQRGIAVIQSLLRAQLGQRVNVMILEKALTLDLAHFEDAEYYDKLTRARREASSRPLSLVGRTFSLVQNAISLVSFAALLAAFSPWAALILILAGLPAFIGETKFSGDAFRLFRWRSPETRMQLYLEQAITREDYAKEVKLYQLGPLFLQRYQRIFHDLYGEDRKLTLRRGAWGYALGLVGTAAFYGAYAWIAATAVQGRISLGEMTMYLLLFRQGQAAVASSLGAVGGMYEDNLYLSTLYEFLAQAVVARGGSATAGVAAGEGLRFEAVSFTYPGAASPALERVSFTLQPGRTLALVGENGSGKTTLIKLLTRLYVPTEGRILLDGRDLQEWDELALRRRIGVIFQDFARYQLKVGENIGAGDVDAFSERARWEDAARQGMADVFIAGMPQGYDTQLGKLFKDGRELSGGQWQKVALSRAFMRMGADILVLDEPTAAMDAEAEAQVFEHVRSLGRDRMTIVISHRFSTVRVADHIVVLHGGKVAEEGDHAALMQRGGRYAHLFTLQAKGYQ